MNSSHIESKHKVEISKDLALPVDAYSLDFDGVLGSDIIMRDSKICLRDRRAFTTHLAESIKRDKPAKVTLFVGSNRQSLSCDAYNAAHNSNGSCFPALMHLSEKLTRKSKIKCVIDPYLIADSDNKLPLGETFCKAVLGYNFNSKHSFDDTKISILYAQIHKFASENPGARYFDFYDDREEIVNVINDCFTEYPDLIPVGITLNLFLVKGIYLKIVNFDRDAIKVIKGTGVIDYNWEEIALAFAKQNNHFNITPDVKPNRQKHSSVAEGLITCERDNYIHWLTLNVLNPIKDHMDYLNQEKNPLTTDKYNTFKDIYNEINIIILESVSKKQTALTLHNNLLKTVADFPNLDVNQARSIAGSAIKFVCGLLLSIPTGFLAWGSQSYRNYFWHTKSQVLLYEVTDKVRAVSGLVENKPR